MYFKHNMLASLACVGLGAALAFACITEAKAEDAKADATGTWSWVFKGRQGGPDRKYTAKLKVEGDKLTGKVSSPNRDGEMRETEVKDGKVKGDEISFTTSREMNGNTITTKYTGKVSG